MDEKLVFRRARPADAARIMEIIRQAQAQMRALGSLQWQDGYPAAADIGHDIACGYGWVFEKPEAEKSTEARGSDGTGAAGFRPETAAARKITDTGEAGATGSGADETAATTEEATEATEETRKAREMQETQEALEMRETRETRETQEALETREALEMRETQEMRVTSSPTARWYSTGNRPTTPSKGPGSPTGTMSYCTAWRWPTARKAAGWRRSSCGASKRWRAGAARTVCASTPISTTVTCCVCSGGWGSSIAGRYATGAANGWHSRKPSGHEGIKRGNRPHGRFPLQDECVTMS